MGGGIWAVLPPVGPRSSGHVSVNVLIVGRGTAVPQSVGYNRGVLVGAGIAAWGC